MSIEIFTLKGNNDVQLKLWNYNKNYLECK